MTTRPAAALCSLLISSSSSFSCITNWSWMVRALMFDRIITLTMAAVAVNNLLAAYPAYPCISCISLHIPHRYEAVKRWGCVLSSSGIIYLFTRLKMAIRFLNRSLWLIILLRYASKDFQVTSEFDSFKIQLQRVVKSTSSRICYAWITRWQRSSFAFTSHGMFFFMSHAGITRWQRCSFAFSSHGMLFLYESKQRSVIKDSELGEMVSKQNILLQ